MIKHVVWVLLPPTVTPGVRLLWLFYLFTFEKVPIGKIAQSNDVISSWDEKTCFMRLSSVHRRCFIHYYVHLFWFNTVESE